MKVQQISIFVENRKGRLSAIAGLLGEAGINIRALSLADTSDFGILRLIVDQPEKASDVLKENSFTISLTEVVAIEVDDEPGGLSRVLRMLEDADVNVEYMYAFVEKTAGKAVLVFRFEEIDKSIEVLRKGKLRILSREEVLRL